ncbi:TFIID-18kDa-domain-containing protein [Nadsonia fulvescens var. elongata DSM 6958]|uniref:Transcription initiation factor TFIID subunit 13 n=1 Tax=Nadsonia fulvescens var. elongata DSM 6958 TaxID=857566 RepID=A0A1E3PK78_9ASCO|nr:TFIID-18kDa-domain-containing protein [Nadsonia fulvescens var. elongata DSM 6958]
MDHTRKRKRSNLFTNDLKTLLYAFGDVANPYAETVSTLEDILMEYIIDMCHEAARIAKTANRQKIKVDDFKFVLRNDPKKLGRIEELLSLQKEIAEARKTFDNSEGKNLSKAYNESDKDKSEKGEKGVKKEKKV